MKRPLYAHQRERSNKRQSTGVPGISFFRTTIRNRARKPRSYFSVFTLGPQRQRRTHRFCVETLGRDVAWRRALALRAEYERTLINQVLK